MESIAQWLGLTDTRTRWVFSLAMLGIAACLLTAEWGTPSWHRNLLTLACLIGALGARMLNRGQGELTKTLPEIYRDRLRSGVRMSFAAKLLSLLCIGLGLLSFVTPAGQ